MKYHLGQVYERIKECHIQHYYHEKGQEYTFSLPDPKMGSYKSLSRENDLKLPWKFSSKVILKALS